MKSRFSRPSLFIRLRHSCDRKYCRFVSKISKLAAVRGCVRRQHQVLLGVGIFLILLWTIGSIWLINEHQAARSAEEILEQQATIAGRFPEEIVTSR